MRAHLSGALLAVHLLAAWSVSAVASPRPAAITPGKAYYIHHVYLMRHARQIGEEVRSRAGKRGRTQVFGAAAAPGGNGRARMRRMLRGRRQLPVAGFGDAGRTIRTRLIKFSVLHMIRLTYRVWAGGHELCRRPVPQASRRLLARKACAMTETRPRRLGRRLLWLLVLVTAVILASEDRDPLTWLVAIVAFAIGCAARPRIDRARRRTGADGSLSSGSQEPDAERRPA